MFWKHFYLLIQMCVPQSLSIPREAYRQPVRAAARRCYRIREAPPMQGERTTSFHLHGGSHSGGNNLSLSRFDAKAVPDTADAVHIAARSGEHTRTSSQGLSIYAGVVAVPARHLSTEAWGAPFLSQEYHPIARTPPWRSAARRPDTFR